MAADTYFTRREAGEYAYTIEATRLKFGLGTIAEVGWDAKTLGMKRVALYTDPRVAKLEHVAIAAGALKAAGLDVVIYDEVAVEPTNRSFLAGAGFAREGGFDGFVSVGGGSVMDTAKASNLYATYPAELLTYVNLPVGEAKPVPGPLKPHIACPTTFGTASECTGMAIFDMLEMEMKTGIANRELRPTLGILDPAALTTLPELVVAANAFDVFSHAIESLTAIPYTERAAPENPTLRPMYQGANPYSEIACSEAIRLIAANTERAMQAPDDVSAREPLMFAGMLAGIGFGNSGCHVPHAMSYAVAGMVRDYHPQGWPDDHAMVPHGISVIVNAPAAFRLIGPSAAGRHLRAAEAMGVDVRNISDDRAGEVLAEEVIRLMRATGVPNGLSGVGYSDADIAALTDRTLPQQRLLDIAPREISPDDLSQLFRDSMRYW